MKRNLRFPPSHLTHFKEFCPIREHGITGLWLLYNFKNLQSSLLFVFQKESLKCPSFSFPVFLFPFLTPKPNYFGKCSPKQRFNCLSSIFHLLYSVFIMLIIF